MKYFTFCRESNNFDDIINDVSFKKHIDYLTTWTNHCRIGINEKNNDNIFSYITIKYGDEMINALTKDHSPIMNIDYIPKK
jgi:hypothetical protein